MSDDREWAIVSVAFDGNTYNASSGMPLDWDIDDDAVEVGDRVADEVSVGAILIPETELAVNITFRQAYFGITKGTKGSLVFTIKYNDGSADKTRTIPNMVFLGQRAGGQKSVPAQNTLRWRNEGGGTITEA